MMAADPEEDTVAKYIHPIVKDPVGDGLIESAYRAQIVHRAQNGADPERKARPTGGKSGKSVGSATKIKGSAN